MYSRKRGQTVALVQKVCIYLNKSRSKNRLSASTQRRCAASCFGCVESRCDQFWYYAEIPGNVRGHDLGQSADEFCRWGIIKSSPKFLRHVDGPESPAELEIRPIGGDSCRSKQFSPMSSTNMVDFVVITSWMQRDHHKSHIVAGTSTTFTHKYD